MIIVVDKFEENINTLLMVSDHSKLLLIYIESSQYLNTNNYDFKRKC